MDTEHAAGARNKPAYLEMVNNKIQDIPRKALPGIGWIQNNVQIRSLSYFKFLLLPYQ
jgi:hypothetical protein